MSVVEAASSNNAQVMDLLHSVCSIWSEHSRSDLSIPPQLQSNDPRQLKEFCVGLLENPTTHPWHKVLNRADSRKALSVAGSLFLFRKAIPAEWSEREMCIKHREATVPACRKPRDPLPPGWEKHVRAITRQQFPVGWDKGYRTKCWTSTPSVGACRGSTRREGGARALRKDRASFLRRALGEEYFEVDNLVRYSVVPTGGKGRGVTIASPDMGVLAPLHQQMYDHLSTLPWLLRGEAKPNAFKSFTRREGEVFVSGDYESASDFVRVESAEIMLDVMESSSRYVPSTVWRAARAFLHCKIQYPDLEVPMDSEAQLMGNLLCFPLLCLQNYVAFRWCFGTDVPVKINGDDIVFRAPRRDYERWADFVSKVGLVLSRGKTLVNEIYFSLNSTFFWSRPARPPRLVPVTRVACFTKQFEDWGSLAGSYRSLTRGFSGEARVLAEVLFLKHFRRRILQAGRSVRRGLGVPASVVSLQRSGLWRRECWYFESVPAQFDELPISPCRLRWGSIPPGWKRVPATSCSLSGKVRFVREGEPAPAFKPRVEVDELQRSFWREVAARTWTEAPTRGTLLAEYTSSVLNTGWEGQYRRWKRRPRKRFLLPWYNRRRCERGAADKWVAPPRQALLWCPVKECDPVEESEEVSVSDLIEYEGLSFSSPDFDYDPRYSLGYR